MTLLFIFTEAKKDDTFGQDDKDWDVYKEIVSYSTVVCTKASLSKSIANYSLLLLKVVRDKYLSKLDLNHLNNVELLLMQS